MKAVQTEKAPAAIGPYSQAIVSNGVVYTSGQIPLDPATGALAAEDAAGQARQVFQNLAAVLEAAGASMGSVIKTTCFLADMADFAAFNEVYSQVFGAHQPARSCVAAKELPKQVLVEVEAIAEIG